MRATVPMHMTVGSTPNHMLTQFVRPLKTNSSRPLCSDARFMARARPYSREVLYPSGSVSSMALPSTRYVFFLKDRGGIRGHMKAQTMPTRQMSR